MAKPVQLGWGVRREGRSLWTRNAVKGVSVRGERRKRDGRNEGDVGTLAALKLLQVF